MASKSNTRKFKVIQDSELQAAIRGFVPVFGNQEDLRIANQLMDLHKTLSSVDNTILRGENNAKHTKKMKDVLFVEKSLIHSIIRRNMDF